MAFKNLEHDGNEEFDFSNREHVKKQIEPLKKKKKEDAKKELERQQAAWMDIENPALWVGEI